MTERLTRLLGIELPIVLGPFGGLSSVELTATVSNGGGLGSYGLYGYTPETYPGYRCAAEGCHRPALRAQLVASYRHRA